MILQKEQAPADGSGRHLMKSSAASASPRACSRQQSRTSSQAVLSPAGRPREELSPCPLFHHPEPSLGYHVKVQQVLVLCGISS